jgi:hypothetical protein
MSAGSPPDGSHLCLACGLCCQGLLHEWAQLEPGETAAAERLGLPTFAHPQGPGFTLPCPRHREGRCTVYDERPSPCSGFRCKLLRRYAAGEVTWEEGLRRIEQAKRLVAAVRRRIGAGEGDASEDGGSVWQQVRAFEAASPAVLEADLRLDLAALLVQCQRHFDDRAQPTRICG